MRKNLLVYDFNRTVRLKSFARYIALFFLFIFFSSTVFSQAQLVKDVNQREDVEYNEYTDFTSAGTTMFFVSQGKELWKSNGTAAGSTRIRSFSSVGNLTPVGNVLYFTAGDGSGIELWKTDGTTTSMVKDIRAGSSGSIPKYFVNANGILYFTANDGKTGYEVWKTDGTAAGTVLVKDIFVGSGSSSPNRLTNVNGIVYFQANNNTNGYELWKSDGTPGGTVMVKDINPGAKVGSFPELLTNLNGILYFVALNPTTGRELWKSNGTAAGTVLVKDLWPGTSSSGIDYLTAVGSMVMFKGNNGTTGGELYKSNGTSAGTVLVKEFTAGSSGTDGNMGLQNLTAINGALYFTANSSIMRSDGTTAGTKEITTLIEPGLGNIPFTRFTLFNGSIYYFNHMTDYYIPHYGFYKMDTNGNNVTLVKELHLGGNWNEYSMYTAYRTNIAVANSAIYLSGRIVKTQGEKLLKSNGTATGTVVIKDAFVATFGSSPDMYTKASNGLIYFRASARLGYDQDDNLPVGEDLWRTDGTTAGTIELKKLSKIGEMEAAGDKVFISAYGENGKWQLWKTDGTTAGTILLKELALSPDDVWPGALTNANGIVFFHYFGELWKSDGTPAGTVKVKDFSYSIDYIKSSASQLYVMSHGSSGGELWKSNGTAAGTVLLKSFKSFNSYMQSYSATAKGIFYFIANDGNGNELWRSNGTPAGTTLVIDLRTNDASAEDYAVLQTFRDSLYFSAQDAAGLWALYKTDGTSASTKKVKNVNRIYEFAAAGTGYLLMFPDMGTGPSEVWATNGTTNGTKSLKVFKGPPYFPGSPEHVSHTVINNITYFNAASALYYQAPSQFWRSDGTVCGTFAVNAGQRGPYPLESIGTNLIFGAGDIYYLRELYRYNTTSAPASPCAATIAAADSQPEIIGTAKEEIVTYAPNPFSNDLRLRVNGKDDVAVQVKIVTMSGQSVEMFTDLRTNTDYLIGNSWPLGMYVIHVNTEGKIITQKVIKK